MVNDLLQNDDDYDEEYYPEDESNYKGKEAEAAYDFM